MSKANELTFKNDMIRQIQANDWLLGDVKQINLKREGQHNWVNSDGSIFHQAIEIKLKTF